jgi:hypothetical protein
MTGDTQHEEQAQDRATATVQAWNDREVRSVPVRWEE